MTEAQTRDKFNAYYADLRDSNRAEGATVNRAREWEFFVAHLIEEGELSEEARKWKCPRKG